MFETVGWVRLVDELRVRARHSGMSFEQSSDLALTLGGRIPRSVGLAAMSRPERELLQFALGSAAGSARSSNEAAGLYLTQTGRVEIGGLSHAEDAFVCAVPGVDVRATQTARERAVSESDTSSARAHLETMGARSRRRILDKIEYALMHMAPVLVYVGTDCYSNFSHFANLPGRSMEPGDDRDRLSALRHRELAQWSESEVQFVEIVGILLASGTSARLEEANGLALDRQWLAQFLQDKAGSYGLISERTVGCAPSYETLERLAQRVQARRIEMERSGVVFYRLIHGVVLNKQEQIMQSSTMAAASVGPNRDAGRSHTAWSFAMSPPSGERAKVLQGFLEHVVEATGSDVAMARGPRSIAFLAQASERDPLDFTTRDFYCCVVPSEEYRKQAIDRGFPIHTLLSAFSSRMRFNSWHYLPDVVGRTAEHRDDWFFVPRMPDITRHSDWHHTGHVKFGVRHAIRVPLEVHLWGKNVPGLYDLRLMRAEGRPYTERDLASALCFAAELRRLHEHFSEACHEPVTEFDNAWHRDVYGVDSGVGIHP